MNPSPWAEHVERALKARPTGHPEPTDQDRYYDGSTAGVAGVVPVADDFPPWTDDQDTHEAEL